MRRSILRWAMTLAAVTMPTWVMAADQDAAQQIANALRGSGRLSDYSIGVKFEAGTAWLLGRVANEDQAAEAIAMAEQLPMVRKVVNNLEIKATKPAAQPAVTTHKAAPAKPVTIADQQPTAKLESAKPETVKPELTHSEPQPSLADPLFPAADEVAAASRMSKMQSSMKNLLSFQSSSKPTAEAKKTPARPAVVRPATNLASFQEEDSEVQPALTRLPEPVAPRTPAPATKAQLLEAEVSPPQPVKQASNVRQASAAKPSSTLNPGNAGKQVNPVQYAANTQRTPARPISAPRPMVQVARTNATTQAMPISGSGGAPAPALASHHNTPAYDQPHLPNHAWPSYAAYPNYAAVTYPKQYSPTAWPYIGPFYPYPQVPLGWRRVSLEWDDGWWFLDFSNRRECRSHH